MLPILWRAEAQSDLAATLEYITERNQQSALDPYDDIERVVSQLPHHPYLYRLGRVSGTRELVAHPNERPACFLHCDVPITLWSGPDTIGSS